MSGGKTGLRSSQTGWGCVDVLRNFHLVQTGKRLLAPSGTPSVSIVGWRSHLCSKHKLLFWRGRWVKGTVHPIASEFILFVCLILIIGLKKAAKYLASHLFYPFLLHSNPVRPISCASETCITKLFSLDVCGHWWLCERWPPTETIWPAASCGKLCEYTHTTCDCSGGEISMRPFMT